MIKSVCGYCGVGCGLEFEENKLIGDVVYPTNEGKLCSKGVSELISIQTPSRLLRPHVRENINNDFKIVPWENAINQIASKIANAPKGSRVLFLTAS